MNGVFLADMIGVFGALIGSFTFGLGLNRRDAGLMASGLVVTVLATRVSRVASDQGAF